MAPAVRSSASAYPQIEAVRAQGLEGIVANRNDSRYESGERTGHWVKYLVQCGQELVIGGYRVGKNDFDNSAVGYHNEAGELIFIAKVNTGLTLDVRWQIFERLQALETKQCPLDNLPEPLSRSSFSLILH